MTQPLSKVAPRIARITVILTDGRWLDVTTADLDIAREYGLAGSCLTEEAEPRLWRLLAFMAGLSPEPIAPEPERDLVAAYEETFGTDGGGK